MSDGASFTLIRYSDGEKLREYWTKDPAGLAKWAAHRHPFTTLRGHLAKYVKNPDGLAASYYHDVFGRWPGGVIPGGKGKRKGKRK